MQRKFVIAYDHRVDKKTLERAKSALELDGVKSIVIEDDGEANDYPVLAQQAYDTFLAEKADGMLLICGTGIGMNIVANKFKGIRSVLSTCEAEAYFSRRHENANCLVIAAGYNDGVHEIKLCRRKMERMIKIFLTTEFEGGRHIRRVSQIKKIDEGGRAE